jgi:serine/threonine protein kinase
MLKAAHNAKTTPGDVKPANFLFVLSGRKLIDFGISSSISPEAEITSIKPSRKAGTINYMIFES